MATVTLYNLCLDSGPLPSEYTTARVGPFKIRLLPEYQDRVQLLPRCAYKKITYDSTEEGLTTQVSFVEKRPGGWVATAEAEFEPESTTSILCDGQMGDGGVWDLCELLTFLTGRRVTVADQLERYNPQIYRAPACIGVETLHAASLAWNNRTKLVDDEIVNALLLHNEAANINLLQAAGALYCAAVNVLHDSEPAPPDVNILAPVKDELLETIGARLEAIPSLTEDQRRAANALIGGALAKGVSPAGERLTAMLTRYGMLVHPMGRTTVGRVRFLNDVRNAVAHRGAMPKLKGLSAEVSDRYTLAILFQVMPGIIRLIVGNKLGFTTSGLGSLSQHTHFFRKFFERGMARDWRIEEQTFREYHYGDPELRTRQIR